MSTTRGIVAAALFLAVSPPRAEAQTPFLDAVREFAAIDTASDANGSVDVMRRRSAALARMKAAVGEWDRGIKALESRVAREVRDASDARAFQLHVELGLAYRQRGRLDDALREFDAAAAAQPGASDVHLLRALTLDAAAKPAEAGRAFRTAWRRDTPNPVKAYLALTSRTNLDADERERALQVLRGAFDRILAKEKPASAVAFLVLDPVPDSLSRTAVVADAAGEGVFARLAEGKLDAALTAFHAYASAAAGGDDDSPLAHFERGRTAEIQGRHADARRAYTAALAGTLAGRHVLHVAIGRLAQVEGELDAAIEAFGRAVRVHPNDPVIRRELAGAYAAAGRSDEAFAELVAALLVEPRDLDAMLAVGQLFLDTDRSADAIAVLTRAVEMNPARAEAHYALAMALSRAGRAEEAARQFERFERISRETLDHRRREVTGQSAPDERR